MSTFNFMLCKCHMCGNLTDDGGFLKSRWFCLDCLDLLDDVYTDVFF